MQLAALGSAALLNPFRHASLETTRPITNQTTSDRTADSFVGPFPSWTNLNAKYGARGDGIADDTTALQAALDELGNTDVSPVLWIPAGTYRITQTLTWTRTIGDGWMSILGEHPTSTKILWDGAPDEVMFKTHNINNSRFGRLTWDGNGRASVAIQHTSSGSSSGNEHADELFQNVAIGIRGGTMDTQMVAEMSVLRCRFSNCSRAGISVENPNSVDWWIWHSLFENCYVGVTSGYGQGSFHIFNSIFKRSTFADTFIGFASYHVLADNYSLNSRAFCLAPFSWNQLELVIQRNTILDPTLGSNPPEPRGGGLDHLFPYAVAPKELPGPVAVKYYGPLLLLDNLIRSRPGHATPVVEIGEDLVAVGNTFTIENPLQAGKRVLEFENTVADASTLRVSVQAPPEPLPLFDGKIFEVSPGASSDQIQTQINTAASTGQSAVVHLPYGTYTLEQTLVLPPDSDIQLVGDGRTILDWAGASDGVAVQVAGPSHATLRDFVIRDTREQATGLRMTNFDQPAGTVFMQGVQVRGFTHGLNVEGLDHATIELHNWQSTNAFFDPPIAPSRAAVHVAGGTRRASGESTTGRVNWFSGAASGSVPTFRVLRGGSLSARALWHEGRASRVAQLDDMGEFTLLGALLGRPAGVTPAPAIELENFRGKVALVSVNFADAGDLPAEAVALRVSDTESNLRVLLLGASAWIGRVLHLDNSAPNAEVGFLMNRSPQTVGDYVVARDDLYQGQEAPPHTRFVHDLLESARREKPMPLPDLVAGVTALRLYRVYVYGFDTAVHLDAATK